MPKGSKKRRAAAKKKKENEVNIHPSTGSEDLKSREDKNKKIDEDLSSDTLNKPTSSQSAHEQNHKLGQKNEEASLSVESAAASSVVNNNNNKSIEQSQVVEIIRDLKPQEEVDDEEEKKIVVIEGDSNSRHINIDYVESVKDSISIGSSSDSGNSSGSSGSSSSDDESGSVVEKKEDNSNYEEKKKEENCFNSVKDSSSRVDLIEPVVSVSEDVTSSPQIVEVITSEAEKTEDSGLIDSPPKKISPVVIDDSIIESGEHSKETKTPEISDNQHQQVAQVPPTVQPTSWKSCCGLFDVFLGSST